MKEYVFKVKESILITNILMSPVYNPSVSVKDVRIFDSILKKFKKNTKMMPKPKEELSGKEEDKELDQKRLDEYNKIINQWLDDDVKVELTVGEFIALREKFNNFKGFSLNPEERAVVLSIAEKLCL